MTHDSVVHISVEAMVIAMKIAAPFLVAGLVVGLIISVFQAVTQIQEMTLTFIPKIIVTAAVMVIAGPWMLDQLTVYTRDLFLSIPSFVDGG